MQRHGGDIYRNRVTTDFSVNINPLGIPEAVTRALHGAVSMCASYPDPCQEQLKEAVGRMLGVPQEMLLFGNGASELFLAIAHAVKPRRAVIPVPSFYGYEHAARAAGGEIRYHPLREQEGYLPGDDLLQILTEEVDLLFLASPNNPTGRLPGRDYLCRLLEVCRKNKITVVLDECFIEFCGETHSLLPELERYENLLLIRAFTKIFAIPGVRLGYLLSSDGDLRERVRRQLPEWNLSAFAQAAGCACAAQTAFVRETTAYVREERRFLEEHLRQEGLQVFPGEANFLLVKSQRKLYRELLGQGILIRDCGNFRGLTEGYYRIAVRNRADNEQLLRALRAGRNADQKSS